MNQKQAKEVEMQLELKKQYPGFGIICVNCGSGAVGFESDMGGSPESGPWGGISLHCANCGQTTEIYDANSGLRSNVR